MKGRVTFEHACSDCPEYGTHTTGPQAAKAAFWHELHHPGHRGLMSGWSGWHRPRCEWV